MLKIKIQNIKTLLFSKINLGSFLQCNQCNVINVHFLIIFSWKVHGSSKLFDICQLNSSLWLFKDDCTYNCTTSKFLEKFTSMLNTGVSLLNIRDWLKLEILGFVPHYNSLTVKRWRMLLNTLLWLVLMTQCWPLIGGKHHLVNTIRNLVTLTTFCLEYLMRNTRKNNVKRQSDTMGIMYKMRLLREHNNVLFSSL